MGVLDLGEQAACDHFALAQDTTPDPRWPLGLALCGQCGLLQLDHRSPVPEEPLAVESQTLKRHASEVVDRLFSRLRLTEDATVREFSSGHGGSWMSALARRGCTPTASAADLVIDNHSIIHAEDLETELTSRVAALAPHGRLVIEFHHALEQLEQGQFDTVRHGHPLYFTLHSWQAACRRHGLSITDAWREDVFGGCLLVVAQRGDVSASCEAIAILDRERASGCLTADAYRPLADHVHRVVHDLHRHLVDARDAGRSVLGYGAGSKSCTLLGVAGVGPQLLPVVADRATGKHGRRVPGVGIPIVSPEMLVSRQPDEIIILTWDIADEVVAQLRAAGLRDSRFFVPLPDIAEVPWASSPQRREARP